jgi:hypothetical protein
VVANRKQEPVGKTRSIQRMQVNPAAPDSGQPASSPQEAEAVDALTREIVELSSSMRENLQAADKGIAAAGALIVAGLGIALLHKATIVLVALPYGLGIVFFFTLQKYAERLSLAGIKSYLEEVLRKVSHGTSPVMQQHVADYWHKRRSDEKAAYGLYTLVIIASFASSLYVANSQHDLSRTVPFARWMSTKHHLLTFSPKFSGLAYLDAGLLVALLVALCFPLKTMFDAYSIAREKAQEEGISVS